MIRVDGVLYKPRTLGPREAQVLAWLETDRPAVVDVAAVSEAVLLCPRPWVFRASMPARSSGGWSARVGCSV